MVPFQTILALLTLLIMLSSCAQKAPPSSQTFFANQTTGTKVGLNKPTPNPDPLIKPTLPASIDPGLELDEKWTLKLKAEEAQKIYQLMIVAPEKSEKDGTLTKQGQKFNCTQSEDGKTFACEFHLSSAFGVVEEQLPLASVKLAATEAVQKSEFTDHLMISDPKDGTKVRVFIKGSEAKAIFEALNLPADRHFDTPPDSQNAKGVHRAGEDVNCTAIPMLTTPDQPLYSCYLHLDFEKGTIDKVDPNSYF